MADCTHGTVLCGLAGEGCALLDTPALGSVVTLVRLTGVIRCRCELWELVVRLAQVCSTGTQNRAE